MAYSVKFGNALEGGYGNIPGVVEALACPGTITVVPVLDNSFFVNLGAGGTVNVAAADVDDGSIAYTGVFQMCGSPPSYNISWVVMEKLDTDGTTVLASTSAALLANAVLTMTCGDLSREAGTVRLNLKMWGCSLTPSDVEVCSQSTINFTLQDPLVVC